MTTENVPLEGGASRAELSSTSGKSVSVTYTYSDIYNIVFLLADTGSSEERIG